MKNMGKMLKQAQKLQADMMKVQAELAERTVEASAGGVVKAVANGKQQIVSLSISPRRSIPTMWRCFRTWCSPPSMTPWPGPRKWFPGKWAN